MGRKIFVLLEESRDKKKEARIEIQPRFKSNIL